jgi:hypothetical protein
MSGDKDVFISYSRDDRRFAEDLVRRLESDGVSTWIDYKDAAWGRPFPVSIEEGLDRTRHIICLMSPSWTASAWAQIERYSAMVDDPNAFIGKLLPILIAGETQIPRFIKPLVYIDCTTSGSLDNEYPRIRDHIIGSRAAQRPSVAATLLTSTREGLPELSPLRYVFVVGHPGAGKSTFCRFLVQSLTSAGIRVDRRSDYPYLQALFRLDLARGDDRRFEPHPTSEFKVKDPAVFDEALKLIHDDMVSVTASDTVKVFEFARPHYDSSFLYYTLRALVNSAIIHVDAPLHLCQGRNEHRRSALERRLAGVPPEGVFDADPDAHYVPPEVYEQYRRDAQEWENQALVLALMPSRGYFCLENDSNELQRYRDACERVISGPLRSLITSPEPLKEFYQRRLATLESFARPAKDHH